MGHQTDPISEENEITRENSIAGEKFRDIVMSSPSGMHLYQLDPGGNLRLAIANPSADRMLGIQHADLLGQTVEEAFPNLAGTGIPDLYKEVALGKVGPQSFEIPYQDERFSGFYSVHVFQTTYGSITAEFTDITAKKEVEELKRKSAEQKEVLLREIHHRVKNNLAIVISLLNFQLRSNQDENLARLILDIQMRIRSMALIHEHLYRSENLDRIPLATYIDALSYIIMTAFSGHRIVMKKDLEPLDASIETALPVGLIINELLTNAFKYAFPGGRPGVIMLRLSDVGDGECIIGVSDDGIGLPENITIDPEKSLGLYIVNLLAQQLDGSVQISRNPGTAFEVRIRNLRRVPGQAPEMGIK